MQGRFCRLEPLDADRHASDLFAADRLDADGRGWTYMSVGPFATLADFHGWVATAAASADPLHHAIIDLSTGRAVGSASYMRIDRNPGVIEVGFIKLSPLAQRTAAATEAMALMMARAFDELAGPRRRQLQRMVDRVDDLRRTRGDHETDAAAGPDPASPSVLPLIERVEPSGSVLGPVDAIRRRLTG